MNFKNNRFFSKLAIISHWVLIGLVVVAILFSIWGIKLTIDLENNKDIWNSLYFTSDNFDMIYNIIIVMINVMAFSVVSWWFYRAHKNLRQFDPTGNSPLFSIFCWLIPFVNLVTPYRYVKELFQKSNSITKRGETPSLGIWWFSWILTAILVSPVSRLERIYMGADTVYTYYHGLRNYCLAMLGLQCCHLLFLFISIKIIKSYAQVETELEQLSFSWNPESVVKHETIDISGYSPDDLVEDVKNIDTTDPNTKTN